MEKIKAKKPDSSLLQAIDYNHRGKRITVNIAAGEFTCLCPWTGQPDFALIKIDYVPDRKCVELKSLKLYLQSYRNIGIVHESVVNEITNDLKNACAPLEMRVEAEFNLRGGIKTTVSREYRKKTNV